MTSATASAPSTDDSPPLRLRLALSLVSGSALAYEILLTRLFSIIQWHHFAYMMISVAMLGYGVAGTLVTRLRPHLQSRASSVFSASAMVFAASAVGCFLLAQAIPFNALAFLWDWHQPLWLMAIYLLLFVPFLFAAICVCLVFTRFASQAHRVYSFDILGGAAGCVGVVLALFVLRPETVLACVAVSGFLAAALVLAGGQSPSRRAWSLLPVVAAGCAVMVSQLPLGQLRISEYKELAQTLKVMGVRVLDERSSPLGLVTVIESAEVPLRHAPGLSLNAPDEPPPQLGVFTDGEGLSALTRFYGRRDRLEYLDYLTSALPYQLVSRPRVLVLGAGTGSEVLQAIYHRAKIVDAVELNAQIVDIVQRQFAAFSGRPFSQRGVDVHVAEARGFVAASRERYDVIQLTLMDAFGASSAGLYAVSESYIYTVEALERYLDRLAPGGFLAITRWVTLPPRDTLKLFATAVEALEQRRVSDPGNSLALIRGWKTATLIVKNGALNAQEVAALREFCRTRSFDTAWYPGIQPDEAQRYSLLDQPYFYDGASALLGPERDEFIERYKFNIQPSTDDRPYFFQFFRWSTLPELLRLRERGGMPLLEWGYPLVVATLLQAVLVSMLLILLPLRRLRNPEGRLQRPRTGWRTGIYFGTLGIAFMFVEMAFIQKFILFLSHPLYAVAVVLFAFLFSAGIGSALAPRVAGRSLWGLPAVARPVFALLLVAAVYLVLLPPIFEALIAMPDATRIVVSVMLIFPLGFFMGMPFPRGLQTLSQRQPHLVPWAWGVNACASVIGAVLATLLAIHFGFTFVIFVAGGLYLSCMVSFPVRS